MEDAPEHAVNWLTQKGKSGVGNTVPIAHAPDREDVRDPTVEPRY